MLKVYITQFIEAIFYRFGYVPVWEVAYFGGSAADLYPEDAHDAIAHVMVNVAPEHFDRLIFADEYEFPVRNSMEADMHQL